MLRTSKLKCAFLVATLAVTPIAVSFATGLWANGAEDISAAAVTLACYSVMAVFVLSVKAFVLDDPTTVAKISRWVGDATLLLYRLIKSVTDSLLDPARANRLRPETGPEVILHRTRLSSHSEPVLQPSSSWQTGKPTHTRYH